MTHGIPIPAPSSRRLPTPVLLSTWPLISFVTGLLLLLIFIATLATGFENLVLGLWVVFYIFLLEGDDMFELLFQFFQSCFERIVQCSYIGSVAVFTPH